LLSGVQNAKILDSCRFSVPVSTSQAVIGAVLGVGIVKGISTVSGRTLVNIIIAWLLTPAIAGFFATALDFAIHLQYVPNP
jgi:PiT family inorganic phosphate transporter